MRTFKIVDGDILFNSNNEIVMIEGEEEEKQSINRILTTNSEEWFLDLLHGLAYQYFQVKSLNEERARLELTKALSQEQRVKEVLELNFDFDRQKRKSIINFKVRMENGIIEGSEVL